MPIQEVLTVFSLALLVVPLNAQGKNTRSTRSRGRSIGQLK